MSTDHVRLVPRCSDDRILAFFEEIQSEMGFGEAHLITLGSNTNYTNGKKINFDDIKNNRGYVIRRVQSSLEVNGNLITTIAYVRGIRTGNNFSPSMFADHISFDGNYHLKPEDAIVLDAIIHKILGKEPPIFPSASDDSFKDLVNTHHQLITNLHSQNILVSDHLTQSRIRMESEYAELKKGLEAALEVEKRSSEEYVKEKSAELENQKQALLLREQELDDRNNTHVRREIRNDLKKQLSAYKDKFSVSDGTRKLRWPVTAFVVLFEFTCILGIFYFIQESFSPKMTDNLLKYFSWAKSAGLTFVAVGTAMWYLRWLTSWSQRHADAEFQLKQLELDIERASWVVETALEWKYSQQSTIPAPLLEAISRNLFSDDSKRFEKSESPADHLASALLGQAARVELDANGNKLVFDRKGVVALKNATEKN